MKSLVDDDSYLEAISGPQIDDLSVTSCSSNIGVATNPIAQRKNQVRPMVVSAHFPDIGVLKKLTRQLT